MKTLKQEELYRNTAPRSRRNWFLRTANLSDKPHEPPLADAAEGPGKSARAA